MTSSGLRTTAVAALLAPVLLLASTIAYIANGEGLSAGEWPGAIQIWAFVAFGVAIVGLSRLLEPNAPRIATLVMVLGIVGVGGGAAYGLDSIQAAFYGSTVELGESAVAPLALRIPGLAFPLALIILGLMFSRRDGVRVAGCVLTLGALLFPPARIADIEPLAVVSDVLLLVGMVTMAVHLVSSAPGRSTVPASAVDSRL